MKRFHFMHMFVFYVVNSYRIIFQRFLLGCNWSRHQTIELVLVWSRLVFALVGLNYFDYNLFCSFSLCQFQFSIYSLNIYIYIYIYIKLEKINIVSASTKKSAHSWIASQHKLSIVVFHLFFLILVYLFYFILFICRQLYFLFIFILFSHGFLSTHDQWISQSQLEWEIVATHWSISHSEEIKYTADNSLSIGEAG